MPAAAVATEADAWITDAEVSNGKVGVSVFAQEQKSGVYIVVAGYQSGGQMTDCVIEGVTLVEGGNHFIIALPKNSETYKIFLLGSNCAPLCEAVKTAQQVPEDYSRAFAMDYVDETYAIRDRGEQIVSTEFKTMLETLIQETVPDQLSLFRSKVTDYVTPLTRNQAVIMCWYAAVCMGVDDAVAGGETIDYIEEFDDYWGGYENDWEPTTQLLPEVTQYELEIETKFWGTQKGIRTVACAWNVWHLSPTWGMPAIAPDTVEMSMRWTDPFTVEDAVCAVSRLYDSYEDNLEATFAPVDSVLATTPNENILNDAVLKKAQDIADPANCRLFCVSLENTVLGYEQNEMVSHVYDVANIAQWGFNQVQIIFSYKHLFNDDVTQVNLKNLMILDEMIATGLANGLHVTLDMYHLPGHHWYIDVNNNFSTTFDNSIYIDETEQQQAMKAWALLAQRYQSIPGHMLSFLPFSTAEDLVTSPGSNHSTQYSGEGQKALLDMTVAVEQKLIRAIRETDSDRFVFYTIPFNYYQNDYVSAEEYQEIIDSYEAFGAVKAFTSFCEEPYVYYNMNDSGVRQADTQNNAMFIGEYPVRIYAAQKHMTGPAYACTDGDHPGDDGEYAGAHTLTLTGTLPAGTTVEVYIERWSGGGQFQIAVDGVVQCEGAISTEETSFNAGEALSRRVRFAESEKKYSLTLAETAESITLSCTGAGQVWWSGIRLTLPEEYAVERLYKDTEYSANLEGRQYEGITYKLTSELLIGANTNATEWPVSASDDPYRGNAITVAAGNGKLDYISDAIYERADVESIAAWGEMVAQFDIDFFVYWECAAGGSSASAMAYYEDMLSLFDKYGFSWNGRYEYVQLVSATEIDAKTVKRGRYLNFNEERLQTMLRHR